MIKKILMESLHEAGRILLQNFGKIKDGSMKQDQNNIVTQADIDSEKKISQLISTAFPNHNFLGEETGFQDRNSPYTWVIDPLDGTSNFAAGIPWYGVIICLLKNNLPLLAGCYIPSSGDIYIAEKGQGATLNGRSIAVSGEKNLKNVLVAYSLDSSQIAGKTTGETAMIEKLVSGIRNMRATNCLIEMCYTADGRLGACINQTTKIWDIAGPKLIIEEAGGKVTDILGKPLVFNVSETGFDQNYTFVGSNGILHPVLLELIS